jgi:hypothetical protein
MAVYGPVRHQKNIIWTSEASVHIIFFWWVTDRSIYCHMTLSAINYLLYNNNMACYIKLCWLHIETFQRQTHQLNFSTCAVCSKLLFLSVPNHHLKKKLIIITIHNIQIKITRRSMFRQPLQIDCIDYFKASLN